MKIEGEFNMWIDKNPSKSHKYSYMEYSWTEKAEDIAVLWLYSTSSADQTPLNLRTGHDAEHRSEVRILNDGDSWDAKSEYFLRILS